MTTYDTRHETDELIDLMAEQFTNMIYEDAYFQEAQHAAGCRTIRRHAPEMLAQYDDKHIVVGGETPKDHEEARNQGIFLIFETSALHDIYWSALTMFYVKTLSTMINKSYHHPQ